MNAISNGKGAQFPRQRSNDTGPSCPLTYNLQFDTGNGPGEVIYETE
jgi:hypothetical protein